MVVGEGKLSLMSMWQPYATLHYLHKPVDLIMLNTDEHVLTNPAVRYASQQGSVDWFRLWLQGYEDPDPSKADQYVRWRGLKKLQDENDAKERAEKTNGLSPQPSALRDLPPASGLWPQPLSRPAVRYASQQGSVDWFRFWLQGYEDPDPSKRDQYVRWRGLKLFEDKPGAERVSTGGLRP